MERRFFDFRNEKFWSNFPRTLNRSLGQYEAGMEVSELGSSMGEYGDGFFENA